MGSRHIATAAAIGILTLGLSGCDEPAYDGPRDRPAYTAEQDSQAPTATRSQGMSGGGSAYGGATRSAQGLAGKAAQHQERIREESGD